ncbi:MAG: (d)CMP kinase [Herpetosiphonaceae bacterium]|nr:(d)CMP kinase [Herpetosiphonaceae bacterium]
MSTPSTIAIDGPAASGKSTLGQMLAHHLGYLYFDTGVLYRALTYVALKGQLDLASGPSLANLAGTTLFTVLPPTVADGRQYTVIADGEDITWMLRSAQVERHVSQVSSHPRVREILQEQQRQIGHAGHVVMAGRDIGVVVMPDADLKIYLDASVEERAQRRTSELRDQGRAVEYAEVLNDLIRRDARDAQNTFRAADAVALSTEGRSPEQLVHDILYLTGMVEKSSG